MTRRLAGALLLALLHAMPLTARAQGPVKGFDCLIEPSQVVEVRSPVDGVIASVSVKRGDAIRRGQTLVDLQSGAERAAVDSARYRAKMDGRSRRPATGCSTRMPSWRA